MLYDCFPFFNELDLLELRLHTLDPIVDCFVLVEATKTHTNKDKPLYFYANKQRFAQFLPKIRYFCVDSFPAFVSTWIYENIQRNSIAKVLSECGLQPTDTVLVSDADEIFDPKAIAPHIGLEGILGVEMKTYIGYLNCRHEPFYGPYMASYHCFSHLLDNIPCQDTVYAPAQYNQGTTPTRLRMLKNECGLPILPNAGWHFSSLGGMEAMLSKFTSTTFVEEPTFAESVQRLGHEGAIAERIQFILQKANLSAEKIDDTFPQYILDNPMRFAQYIYSYPYIV